MSKQAIKLQQPINTSQKIRTYLKKQPTGTLSLKEIQKSLSGIGISLSKRVIIGREQR